MEFFTIFLTLWAGAAVVWFLVVFYNTSKQVSNLVEDTARLNRIVNEIVQSQQQS